MRTSTGAYSCSWATTRPRSPRRSRAASELALAEMGLPVLAPADPQDILDLGLHGVALSRFCGLWVGLKLATSVADGAATVDVAPDRVQPVLPDRSVDGEEFAHEVSARFLAPTLQRLEETLTGQRLELARRYARANHLNTVHGDPRARIGIVCAGATYLDVRHALRTIGVEPGLDTSGIRVLRLGMVSPLVPSTVLEFATGLDELVVVEEKRPLVELGIKDILYGRVGAPVVTGRTDLSGEVLFRRSRALPSDLIAEKLAARILAHTDHDRVRAWAGARVATDRPARRLLPIAARTPHYCSGCPHNRSTRVPDGSLVGAGIGCSALAALMPQERFGDIVGFTQMGGEGASWVGMAPSVESPHLIQNLGDGTFHHSGSLAIRNAVAAKVRITYKILYNGAVAMTGGQQPVGSQSVADIVGVLRAEGVEQIVITTDEPRRYRRSRLPRGVRVEHRDDLDRVQRELAAVEGVTALVHDQECATELRRKRRRGRAPTPTKRVLINERVCEGCGDCGAASNCMSVQPVQTEFGRKTRIHQDSCNLDYSCLRGDCPSFVTVEPAAVPRARAEPVPDLPSQLLPDPVVHVPAEESTVRITGMGAPGSSRSRR
ncbi:thiamine pyrophosphate-dependent enzyme [Pseudonocardia benzenivorans]